MDNLINNLNPEILKFVLGLAFVLVALLTAVVGFFLRSQFKILATVKDTVEDLKTVVEVLRSQQKGSGMNCITTHKSVDARFNTNDKKLDEHSERLAVVETILNIQKNEKEN